MWRFIGQAACFTIIGATATLVHVAVALALAEGCGVAVLWANFWAFCAAVLVSYLGNYRWTFGSLHGHARCFPRFALTALLGLALNQAIVFAIVEMLGWRYRGALAVVVLVVPAISFLLNRQWVFRTAAPAGDGRRRAL